MLSGGEAPGNGPAVFPDLCQVVTGAWLQVRAALTLLTKINDLVGRHPETTKEKLTALYLPRGTSCS